MAGKTEAPERLDDLQRAAVKRWNRERAHYLTNAQLLEFEEAMLDWHRSEGKRRKDWAATLRVWIRRTLERSSGTTPPTRPAYRSAVMQDYERERQLRLVK